MLRVLGAGVGLGAGRRLAALGLVALGGVMAPFALRARRLKARKRPAVVEVGHLELDGRRCAAVYEDGKLVGVLEGFDRL